MVCVTGYTVLSGKFDFTDRVYYVASSPRSSPNGQVVFFQKEASGILLNYQRQNILSGDQAFSGYGQDMIAVDIDNDG